MVTAARPVSQEKRGGNYLTYALHALVLAGLIAAGLKFIRGDMLWRAFHRFDWASLPFVLMLTIAYVLVKGTRFAAMMRELTHHSRGLLMRAYVAGQACTLLPGGMAARAGMLRQVGIPASDTAAPIAISGLSDQFVFIACSMISALWFESARRPVLILLSILMGASILLGVEATRTWLSGMVERLMGRFRLLNHWCEFLTSLREVATPRMIIASVANAALAAALMVVALDLCALGVGAEVPYPTLLLAYTMPTMLGRISAMPGGVGVTEAGMIGILNATPGVTLDQAAAATAVFRLGTVGFAALFGGFVYAFAWRGRKEEAAE